MKVVTPSLYYHMQEEECQGLGLGLWNQQSPYKNVAHYWVIDLLQRQKYCNSLILLILSSRLSDSLYKLKSFFSGVCLK